MNWHSPTSLPSAVLQFFERSAAHRFPPRHQMSHVGEHPETCSVVGGMPFRPFRQLTAPRVLGLQPLTSTRMRVRRPLPGTSIYEKQCDVRKLTRVEDLPGMMSRVWTLVGAATVAALQITLTQERGAAFPDSTRDKPPPHAHLRTTSGSHQPLFPELPVPSPTPSGLLRLPSQAI